MQLNVWCMLRLVPPRREDISRYRDNYLMEKEGAALYHALAAAESDSDRAEIFRKLALTEERHCDRWRTLIETAGDAAPKYKSSWRVGVLGFLARRLGTNYILPVLSRLEAEGQNVSPGRPKPEPFRLRNDPTGARSRRCGPRSRVDRTPY